jgi:uncharacterized protein (TIGR00730 family)
MRVAVYCSSSPAIDPEFVELAFNVGVAIADEGWELVWGGGAISMMGAVARGARSRGGTTIGVIPERLVNLEFQDKESTELHYVADMRARKGKIEEISDAFITLPGGIGTLEEFFEIWVGRYLGFHSKPIAVCDPTHAYAPLRESLHHLTQLQFMKPGQEHLVEWCTDISSAIAACRPAQS